MCVNPAYCDGGCSECVGQRMSKKRSAKGDRLGIGQSVARSLIEKSQRAELPEWMRDRSLLPKRPPRKSQSCLSG